MRRNKAYDLHPEAQGDIEAAYEWYSQRNSDASIKFLTNIDEALDVVTEAPYRWPEYHGTRRYLIRDFPFALVYINDPGSVRILAVAHHKRRPGFWKARL
jgi:plasmid stabilization system protein ParE